MTTTSRSHRGPPKEPPEPAGPSVSRGREILGKGISHVSTWGAVWPLMLGSTAIAAAATVHTWPAVAAVAVVLVLTIVWVGLGPTVRHTESMDEHTTVREHQLVFARRAAHRTKIVKPVPLEPADEKRRLETATPATIRAWALAEGMDVHRTGPLPRIVVTAWNERSAQNNELHLTA